MTRQEITNLVEFDKELKMNKTEIMTLDETLSKNKLEQSQKQARLKQKPKSVMNSKRTSKDDNMKTINLKLNTKLCVKNRGTTDKGILTSRKVFSNKTSLSNKNNRTMLKRCRFKILS